MNYVDEVKSFGQRANVADLTLLGMSLLSHILQNKMLWRCLNIARFVTYKGGDAHESDCTVIDLLHTA